MRTHRNLFVISLIFLIIISTGCDFAKGSYSALGKALGLEPRDEPTTLESESEKLSDDAISSTNDPIAERVIVRIDSASISAPAAALPPSANFSLEKFLEQLTLPDNYQGVGDTVRFVATNAQGETVERTEVKDNITVTIITTDASDDDSNYKVLLIANYGTDKEEKFFIPRNELTVLDNGDGTKSVVFETRETDVVATVINGDGDLSEDYQLYIAAAPNPKDLNAIIGASETEDLADVTLNWSSGGGTTAGYIISYQENKAPEACDQGSIVGSDEIGNNLQFTITGLEYGKTYGFRVCAINFRVPSDVSFGIISSVQSAAQPSVQPEVQEIVIGGSGGSLGPLTLTSVFPPHGALEGNYLVTISGENITTDTTVKIGGKTCPIDQINETMIRCLIPDSDTVGSVSVIASMPSGSSYTFESSFTYRPAPTITSVAPNNGTLAGGEKITISGTNFLEGASVNIDDSECSLVSLSGTSIECTVAANSGGSYAVSVLNGDSQLVTFENGYTYNYVPQIFMISPNAGADSGGNLIYITGNFFVDGSVVSIDGQDCTQTNFVSASVLECLVPAHLAGVFSVTVTNPDSQSITLGAGYTYDDTAITIAGIAPNNGSQIGSTVITITGTNFVDGVTAQINSVDCPATFIDSETITCVTPALAAGLYDVELTNPAPSSDSTIFANGFTYNPALVVSSINPTSGTNLGGTAVVITGDNFIDGASVLIGTSPCSILAVSSTSITCTTGPGANGMANIKVTNPDSQFDQISGFTYLPPLADPTQTYIKVSAALAPNDNYSKVYLLVIPKDSDGNILGAGLNVEIYDSGISAFFFDNPEACDVPSSNCLKAKDEGTGAYTISVRSANVGTLTLTAKLAGDVQNLDSIDIEFDTSQFTVIPNDTDITSAHAGLNLLIDCDTYVRIHPSADALVLGHVFVKGGGRIQRQNTSQLGLYIKPKSLTMMNGYFEVTKIGYSGNTLPLPFPNVSTTLLRGGSNGGQGAVHDGENPIPTYGSFRTPIYPGTGSTYRGGGYFRVIASDGGCIFEQDASIRANGDRTGSGGSIELSCDMIGGDIANGAISARGGRERDSNKPAGGGGRIALKTNEAATFFGKLHYPTNASWLNELKSKVRAWGGWGYGSDPTEPGAGGAGTIYLQNGPNSKGMLIIHSGTGLAATRNAPTSLTGISGILNSAQGIGDPATSYEIPVSFDVAAIPGINLYDGFDFRFGQTLSGTGNDWKDADVIRIGWDNSERPELIVTNSNLAANILNGDEFRSLIVLDYLHIGNNVIVEYSNGDIYCKYGDPANPNSSSVVLGAYSQFIMKNGAQYYHPGINDTDYYQP